MALNEVEGAIITRKIRGDVTGLDPLTPTSAAFHIHTKSTQPPTLKPKGRQETFCVFCENRDNWAQDCKEDTDDKDRTEKLKIASGCFLCLNRGHSLNCSKKGKFHCSKCGKSHHSICIGDQPVSTSVNQIDSRVTSHRLPAFGLRDPPALRSSRCLLDSGSQSNFIHTSLVDHIQLSVVDKRDVIITPFESTAPLFTHEDSCSAPSNRHGLREWAHTRHTRPFPTM
jgi:hypothetical protein